MSEAVGELVVPSQVALPSGWKRVRLGNVARKIGSGITPLGGQSSYVSSGVPLIRSQNVHLGRFEPTGLAFISSDQDAAMIESRVYPGDVLLNITGASIGRVCLVPAELCPANVNQHVAIIRPDSSVSAEFLAAYLASPNVQGFIWGSQAGATRQALTKAQIVQFEIPLPPLAEQRRIAAALRTKLAGVELARAALAAQLAAAEALPAAHLRAAFDSDTAHAWPLRALGEVLRVRNEIVHPRDKPNGRAIFVGLEHIEPGTGIRVGSVEFDLATLTGRKARFMTGDLVYGYLRPYLNKVWQAEFDGYCSVDQYVFIANETLADPDYAALFMRSPIYLERAPVDIMQSQLPRIRSDEVAQVKINLPDLVTQRRLAALLKEKLATAAALRAALEVQAADLEKLPAAFLREAFAGRL